MTERCHGSELAVAGSCCMWPDRIAEIDLTPEDFTDEGCARIFRAAREAPEAFDPVVAAALPGVGPEFVKRCMETAASVHELGGHVARVREGSRLRRLRQGVEDAFRAAPDAEGLAGSLRELTETVMDEKSGVRSIGDALRGMCCRWDRPEARILCGLRALDDLTRGFRPGQYIILAARPGVGKSALAAQMAWHMARQGRRVMLISLEMSAEDQAARLVAMASGEPLAAVTDGSFRDERQQAAVTEAAAAVSTLPILIDDRTDVTAEQITSRVRLHRPEAVIVDYVGLVSTPGRGTRNDEIAAVSRTLKCMALRLGVPVIVLCQLNRGAGPEERPALSALRDSGSLEQDADLVMLLWRSAPGHVTVTLAKNRQGPTGEAELAFEGGTMTFREPGGIKDPPPPEDGKWGN